MPPDGRLMGFAADVRNTDRYSETRQTRFTWNHEMSPTPRSMGLFIVGRPMPHGERAALNRTLVRLATRRLNVSNVIRLLVEAIRIRARDDEYVGHDVMVCCIPRTAADPILHDIAVSRAEVRGDAPSFFYSPRASDDRRPFAPTLVCGNTVVVPRAP